MNEFTMIATLLSIHLMGAMSPGPDFLLIVKNSLMYSRRAAFFTAIGLGLGVSVHILYSLAGVAYIISQSILLFTICKTAGGVYLLYLGFKSFRSTSAAEPAQALITPKQSADLTNWQAVKMGFLTNVLNPKVTLFFLGLFTVVIDPSVPFSMVSIMGSLMVIDTIIWFSLVAVLFTQPSVKAIYLRFEKAWQRIFGVMLMSLGIKVLSTK